MNWVRVRNRLENSGPKQTKTISLYTRHQQELLQGIPIFCVTQEADFRRLHLVIVEAKQRTEKDF